ncbi:chaperone protein cofactor GrpE [Corynebacterium diphtheriae BH8]|uniref:nucleotide exchange factor GrpE n=1 Tax=Corynebacterium diphtheriae TaxID=1717 RepID=UPI000245AC64|nr:nucleotide exchange factor GrpE [Corynebacterium diphtheriae]AEX49598.1 chaperone protein cofactor GrpE [Corynebacterium diphtheriae BH8]CAB0527639.1 nucleotide exchange factor GrpE [Corynebacterium diphtheriae]CAB0872525.1 nucleotide exchange factor GrpE [Corynebacterium diphtheriae]CAB0978999.1 nucleotide exchange factor GrpE [Corynebacterium diphtheriae]CAB1009471.1 nucleotide exchange factor GrpE [Corynebacterium diphtheriae]
MSTTDNTNGDDRRPGQPEWDDEENNFEHLDATEVPAEEEALVESAGLDADTLADLEDAFDGVDASTEDPGATVGETSTLESELAERTEDLQRLSAEYANYRRRTDRERKVGVEAAKAKVLGELLPILDDLELAQKHGDLDEGPLKAFRDKLVSVVEGLGVSAFGAEGDEFDAERHEAVQDLSSGDHKVLGTVLRRGYQMNDRLLRTAMVIIADPAEDAQ